MWKNRSIEAYVRTVTFYNTLKNKRLFAPDFTAEGWSWIKTHCPFALWSLTEQIAAGFGQLSNWLHLHWGAHFSTFLPGSTALTLACLEERRWTHGQVRICVRVCTRVCVCVCVCVVVRVSSMSTSLTCWNISVQIWQHRGRQPCCRIQII